MAAGLFALNVALNVACGYAAMARFFSHHPNPWGWNPTRYCGLPAQFNYLPGLPYLAAAVSRLAPAIAPEYAYRIVTALFACLGPATLFLFVLCGIVWLGALVGLVRARPGVEKSLDAARTSARATLP
jgi:hypothetical protein